jgi:hypothetical protein
MYSRRIRGEEKTCRLGLAVSSSVHTRSGMSEQLAIGTGRASNLPPIGCFEVIYAFKQNDNKLLYSAQIRVKDYQIFCFSLNNETIVNMFVCLRISPKDIYIFKFIFFKSYFLILDALDNTVSYSIMVNPN